MKWSKKNFAEREHPMEETEKSNEGPGIGTALAKPSGRLPSLPRFIVTGSGKSSSRYFRH